VRPERKIKRAENRRRNQRFDGSFATLILKSSGRVQMKEKGKGE